MSVKLPKSNTPSRSTSILRAHTPNSTSYHTGGSDSHHPNRDASSVSFANSSDNDSNSYRNSRETAILANLPLQRNIVLYRRRWLMLFVNFLLNTANSTVWVAVSSIQAPAVQLYGVSPDQIVLLTNLVYILFIPGTIVSSILLSKYGLYTTSGTGAVLLCLASWCRVFSAFNHNFIFEIIASIVFSVGQPLVMNGVGKFNQNWMAPKERFVATMMYNTVPASLG